jgi:hypothetical protein
VLEVGAVTGLVRAIAGLIAAKSISEPTRNTDSLIEVVIRIHLFFVKNYTINLVA